VENPPPRTRLRGEGGGDGGGYGGRGGGGDALGVVPHGEQLLGRWKIENLRGVHLDDVPHSWEATERSESVRKPILSSNRTFFRPMAGGARLLGLVINRWLMLSPTSRKLIVGVVARQLRADVVRPVSRR
jgi:hypothetical protein